MSTDPGILIGFILTLFIYSYLVKDNPLYRLAIHILVGVSAGYAALIAVRQILGPVLDQIRSTPVSSKSLAWLLPLLLALLLLYRRMPIVGRFSNLAIGLLIGVGATLSLLGAITGTLWPQVTSEQGQNPFIGLLVALFVISTLFVFQFTGKESSDGTWVRPGWQRSFALIGQFVLTVTFGAIFVNVFSTSLVLLIARISDYLSNFTQLIS